jgi:hypothetical protein
MGCTCSPHPIVQKPSPKSSGTVGLVLYHHIPSYVISVLRAISAKNDVFDHDTPPPSNRRKPRLPPSQRVPLTKFWSWGWPRTNEGTHTHTAKTPFLTSSEFPEVYITGGGPHFGLRWYSKNCVSALIISDKTAK